LQQRPLSGPAGPFRYPARSTRSTQYPLDSGFALVQRFMTLNEVADHAGRELRYEAVTEYVGIGAHGSNTQIDGLAHYSWDGKNDIADPWQLSGLLPTEIQTSVVPLGQPTGN
jgi:hypothetical protein